MQQKVLPGLVEAKAAADRFVEVALPLPLMQPMTYRAPLGFGEVRRGASGGQAAGRVAVDFAEAGRTETLLGACAARHNRQQSVVHAVLAALNRRLGLFALHEAAGEG